MRSVVSQENKINLPVYAIVAQVVTRLGPKVGNPLNPARDGDWGLQLFPMNEEFPVSTGHKLVLIKSLPFVHTPPVATTDWMA